VATPIPLNRARFSLSEVAAATQGTILHDGVDEIQGVTSDSRAVTRGSMFVALRGDAHDGHAFLDGAVATGAQIMVVERGRAPQSPAAGVVEVDDTLVAWGALARAHLEKWRVHALGDPRSVVAITGSAGKTTTKELCAALLAQVAPTHFTAGNLNNRIGVPAVIFGLSAEHRFCVLEMGMSLSGELDAITAFARPDVSVIVNVGVAHAEGAGGREGIMHEKGAVYRALGRDGIAIVNADDPWVMRAAKAANVANVVAFGCGEAARYRLVDRAPDGLCSRVVVSAAGRELSVRVPLPGEAVAVDLVAAIAAQEAASSVLLPAERIEHAIASVRPASRGTARMLEGDIVLLDDTYNANPQSMRAALSTLREIGGARRTVAILGEMKELGAVAESEHEALGDAIADAHVVLAIGCGGLMARALERARARGVGVVDASTTEEAAAEATRRVVPGDAVLVKGSRSVGVERVVRALLAKAPEVLPNPSESATSRMR
jgi:UDP-N-acetylmuramoyl-tripeptide--D-alanyl-D-alanine ligase